MLRDLAHWQMFVPTIRLLDYTYYKQNTLYDVVFTLLLVCVSKVPILCFSAHESTGVGMLSNRYFEEDTDALVTELIVEVSHIVLQYLISSAVYNMIKILKY